MNQFFVDFIRKGILKKANLQWCILYDYDTLEKFAFSATKSFPERTNHCFAVKSNPLTSFLRIMYEDFNFGMECASIGEVFQSLKVCPPSKIVFDSPCKTKEEILLCLKKQIYMNADNFEEIRRVERIIQKEFCSNSNNNSININPETVEIGIRVNPIVGAGTEKITSTATEDSKFGIPFNYFLSTNGELEKWFVQKLEKDWKFIVGLHSHVGSVGMSREQAVLGVKRIVDLAKLINNELGEKRIRKIDIGGGLPLQSEPEYSSYFEKLNKTIENLEDFEIITEFGRSMCAPSGVIISEVEYIKETENKMHVAVHCGADIFCRTAYSRRQCVECGNECNSMMIIEGGIFDNKGNQIIEEEEEDKKKKKKMDIVGPLCFSGDVIIKDMSIVPKAKEGDFVVFYDCGGYTLSCFSKYCSRPLPAVFLKKENEYLCIKKQQSIHDCIKVWD